MRRIKDFLCSRVKGLCKAVKFAAQSLGRRGATLLFWSFVFWTAGWGATNYSVTPNQKENLRVLLEITSYHNYGILYLITAAIMTVGAFKKSLEGLAFLLGTFLASIIGVGYLAAMLTGETYRAGTTVAIYIAVAIKLQLASGWKENWENHRPRDLNDINPTPPMKQLGRD